MSEGALELVYSAIDEVNAQFDGVVIQKKPATRLLGGNEGVDSVVFLNLVIALEERIQEKRGVSVVLVDQDSMALEEQPFRSVETLANYVEKLLAAQPQN